MKSLRRFHLKKGKYFITIVTYNRQHILLNDTSLFWKCWPAVMPEAWCILPDHCHLLMNISNDDVSKVIHGFKIKYSRLYRDHHGPGRVWQNRFWDHIIRDESDWRGHIDYVHFNAVKHGLTDDPFEYVHSSLGNYYRDGLYERNWGVRDAVEFSGEFGEWN